PWCGWFRDFPRKTNEDNMATLRSAELLGVVFAYFAPLREILCKESRAQRRNARQVNAKRLARTSWVFLVFGLIAAASDPAMAAEPAGKVTTLRVPHGGIQPQLAVDDKGTIHLIYFRGDPGHGDLF